MPVERAVVADARAAEGIIFTCTESDYPLVPPPPWLPKRGHQVPLCLEGRSSIAHFLRSLAER